MLHTTRATNLREGYINKSDIPDIKTVSQLIDFVIERYPHIEDVYNVEMFNYKFYFSYTEKC